jgi:hypothetical protein
MKRKIVAVHKSDAFEHHRNALIGRTGHYTRGPVKWKHGTVLGPKHYEYGDFMLDTCLPGFSSRELTFYAVSTMPVKQKKK